MKKVYLATAVFAIGAFAARSMLHTPSTARTDAPQVEAAGEPVFDSTSTIAGVSAALVAKPPAQAQAAGNQNGSSEGALNSGTPALAVNSPTFLKGFERLSIDPAKEKAILNSKMPEASKTLLLSGIALIEARKSLRPTEVGQATITYVDALRKDESVFQDGVRALVSDRANLADDLGDDLLELAIQTSPKPLPELSAYAVSRVRGYVSAGSLANDENRLHLIDAMTAAVTASKDRQLGWAAVDQAIDMNDPAQKAAYDTARELMSFKTGSRMPASQ